MRPPKRKVWFWSGDLGEDLLVQDRAEQPGTSSYIEFITGPLVLGFRKCNLEFVFLRVLGTVHHRGSNKTKKADYPRESLLHPGGRMFYQ